MKKNDIYDKAIQHYGKNNQLLQTCEECSELIQAISKAVRFNDAEHILGVAEEISDVEIMIEQIKRIFGINQSTIDSYKNKKLNRLEQYIETDQR